jgi:hypothetical protein
MIRDAYQRSEHPPKDYKQQENSLFPRPCFLTACVWCYFEFQE